MNKDRDRVRRHQLDADEAHKTRRQNPYGRNVESKRLIQQQEASDFTSAILHQQFDPPPAPVEIEPLSPMPELEAYIPAVIGGIDFNSDHLIASWRREAKGEFTLPRYRGTIDGTFGSFTR